MKTLARMCADISTALQDSVSPAGELRLRKPQRIPLWWLDEDQSRAIAMELGLSMPQ